MPATGPAASSLGAQAGNSDLPFSRFLAGRQRDRNGLREGEVEISDELLRTVIAEYTREAGVRSLERELGTLLRKTATKIAATLPAEGTEPPAEADEQPAVASTAEAAPEQAAVTPVEIDLETVREALGSACATSRPPASSSAP